MTTTTRRQAVLLRWAAVASMALSGSLVACTAAPPTRSGGADRPVTLRIAAFTVNSPAPETADHFRQAATSASGGTVSFTRLPDTATPEGQTNDQSSALIKQVRDGSIDVGIVASRSFDLIGVTSLQAFNAPLVVNTPAQATALLADPVTEPMLAGLDKVGLVGLGFAYNQLRQPLGFGKAIRTPADLKGGYVIGRPSKASEALFTGLGATYHTGSDRDQEAALTSGRATASEISFQNTAGLVSGTADHPAFVTANVQLSILADVIVVNAKSWAKLSARQQDALRAAMSTTRDWAATTSGSLASARDAYCSANKGNVVVATSEELNAWRSGVAPFVKALRAANPVTGKVLDRAKVLVDSTAGPDPVTPCTMTAAGLGALPTPVGNQEVVAGVWRLDVTSERLTTAGASTEDARRNEGTWTFTIHSDGSYSYVEPKGREATGRFAIVGNHLDMAEDGGSPDGRWAFTFERTGNRLILHPTPAFAATWSATNAFFSEPLTRIGDAPGDSDARARVTGTWRFTIYADRLTAAGATAQEVRMNAGVMTYALRADGSFTGQGSNGGTACSGRYTVAGDRLTLKEESTGCDGILEFSVKRAGDKLTVVPIGGTANWAPAKAFYSDPWTRIGDAPTP